ncbi:hypothetical protein ACFQZ4_23975 [Catellatospora coxensis]
MRDAHPPNRSLRPLRKVRRVAARKLCGSCTTTVRRDGTRDQWPRVYRRLADVVEDYRHLHASGESEQQITRRLGYAHPYSSAPLSVGQVSGERLRSWPLVRPGVPAWRGLAEALSVP